MLVHAFQTMEILYRWISGCKSSKRTFRFLRRFSLSFKLPKSFKQDVQAEVVWKVLDKIFVWIINICGISAFGSL